MLDTGRMTSNRSLSFTAVVALLAALVVAAVPAAADSEPAGVAATKSVTVGDNFFSPTSRSIKRNDSIRFSWNGTDNRHNVAVRSGPAKFKSKTRRGSYTYTRKFGTKGTYKLYCTLHPDSMKATVKVR